MEEKKFTVRFDPKAYSRHSHGQARKEWRRYAAYDVRYAMYAAIVALSIGGVTIYTLDNAGRTAALLTATLCGFVLMIAYQIMERMRWYEDVVASSNDGPVHYEMTDDALIASTEDGWTAAYPWKTLSIEYESPDGYSMVGGGDKWVLQRKPLADAGLEAEFLERMTK